jgi:hypothetical protein
MKVFHYFDSGVKTVPPSFCFAFFLTFCPGCRPCGEANWSELFNGKDLSGWDTYLGPRYDTAARDFAGEPVGLNNDSDGTFSVVRLDGRDAIRIAGKHFGGISTEDEFSNFHLTLQFRWGTQKWPPRKDKVRDSGLLYHAVGPHGADYGFWMRSQEFQIQEGDCGDYWGVGGGVFDIPAVRQDSVAYVYSPGSALVAFSSSAPAGRRCIKNPDAENPTGEWNTLDLYCHGDTAVHVVNRQVVMVLYNSRQQGEGGETPLTRGKIQLQSEGAEVFYSDIRIRPIRHIDPALLGTRSGN